MNANGVAPTMSDPAPRRPLHDLHASSDAAAVLGSQAPLNRGPLGRPADSVLGGYGESAAQTQAPNPEGRVRDQTAAAAAAAAVAQSVMGPPPRPAYTTGPQFPDAAQLDRVSSVHDDVLSNPSDQNETGEGLYPDALEDHPNSAYNQGTWTASDDRALVSTRQRGQRWADIQREHFPTKTANACRKRYERLMERRGVYTHDTRKLERISKEYIGMRKQIWSGLAARVGEKWNVVEAQCMAAGLRTIQSNARSYTNRWRRESKKARSAGVAPIGPPTLSPITEGLGRNNTFIPFAPNELARPGSNTASNDPSARTRNDTAAMPPPPFLPPGRTAPSSSPQTPVPNVTFGGYLNGRSSKTSSRPAAAGRHSNNTAAAPATVFTDWHEVNIRAGLPGEGMNPGT